MALYEGINRGRTQRVEECVYVMSELSVGFQTLSVARVMTEKGEKSMSEFVREHFRPPEKVLVDGKEVPLLGMMEVLAASRLMGDTDVLGGGFMNAGFVLEQEGARVFKIDPGFSFNFDGPQNKFYQSYNTKSRGAARLENPRDIQFANMSEHDFKWSALTQAQRDTFNKSIRQGLAMLTSNVMQQLFDRSGSFNTLGGVRIRESTIKKSVGDWEEYLKSMRKMYLQSQ